MVRADTQAELRKLLRELRGQFGDSANRFGLRLAEITGARPYTRSYISLMESGAVGISSTIQRALHTLAKHQIMVRPAPGVQLSPGCVVQKPERVCKREGCGVHFIPDGAAQYCSETCRNQRRKDNANK